MDVYICIYVYIVTVLKKRKKEKITQSRRRFFKLNSKKKKLIPKSCSSLPDSFLSPRRFLLTTFSSKDRELPHRRVFL